MGAHEEPRPHPLRDALHEVLHHAKPDPGHLLPDDEWARVVAEAEQHPANPNHPGEAP